jgi:hypothetical protein
MGTVYKTDRRLRSSLGKCSQYYRKDKRYLYSVSHSSVSDKEGEA